MDNRLSGKITRISFLAMVCVVAIHSQTISAIANPSFWNRELQRLFGSTLTCWAVPFFFMVSGYFFHKSLLTLNSKHDYFNFCKKKAMTLLIPYLLWVVIGTVLAMPLIIGANMSAHRSLFYNTVFGYESFGECLVKFFGLHGAPMGNFPLWYVRSLMLIFLFSPLWKLVAKIPIGMQVALGLALSLYDSHIAIPFVNVMTGSTGYFIVGLAIAGYGLEKLRINGYVFAVACLTASAIAFIRFFNLMETTAFIHLYELMPYCLIAVIWRVYDVCASHFKTDIVFGWMKWTFWIYCLHNSFVGVLPAIGLALFGKTDVPAFIIFVVNPIIVVLGTLFLAKACFRFSPKIFKVMTGGRI